MSPPSTGARSTPLANRMGIVETNKTLACSIVKRQAVTQTMWPLRARHHAPHDKPDVVASLRINEKRHAIQRQKCIQPRISFDGHNIYYQTVITMGMRAARRLSPQTEPNSLTQLRLLFKRKP